MNIALSGADPGFPIGGMPILIEGGANLRYMCFSVKTCKNKRIWSCWGGGGAPETFVCRSATDYGSMDYSGPENPMSPMLSVYFSFHGHRSVTSQ